MYLAYPSVLWCERVKQRKDGKWSFNVINGDWTGVYDPVTFEVYVNVTRQTYQGGPCLWVGRAPYATHNYNAAIAWIEEECGAPLLHRPHQR